MRFFFALAYLGWFVSAYVLFATTAMVLTVMWQRQFASDARRPCRTTMIPDDYEIELTLVRLVTDRGADKTVCPSEVARALGGPHPDGWGP